MWTNHSECLFRALHAETGNKSHFHGKQEKRFYVKVERLEGVLVIEIRKEHIKLGAEIAIDLSQSLIHTGLA